VRLKPTPNNSSTQDKRRHARHAHERQAAYKALETTVCPAAKQEYFCQADAEAAAEQLRALPSAYHQMEVVMAVRSKYGPVRPRAHMPRPITAMRYGVQITVRGRHDVLRRKSDEAACFVLLTNVPRAGAIGHSATEPLQAYKNQHGIEQNYAFLKDPLIVHSLFLKKPERIEALGLVLLLALLLWRLVERTLRLHVETTGNPLIEQDKKETQKPTAFMMMTKFSAVMVVKVGPQRQLEHPFSTVQQQYLLALGVPTTYFTGPPSG
jgi:transposase